jgi:peptidylprolyl isomerase
MRRLATMAVMVAFVVSACGTTSPDPSVSADGKGHIKDVVVGLSDGLAPSLEFEFGLEYPVAQNLQVWNGEGDRLVEGQPLLLDIYAQSLDDGSELINTFDGLPRPFVMAPEILGDGLHEALTDARVGARLLHISPAGTEESGEPPFVMVVDVLPVKASGTAVDARAGLPSVTLDRRGEPTISVDEDSEPSGDLHVATLIQGGGPQIRSGSYVVVNYVAMTWEDGEVFQSSWEPDTAPFETQIGTGRVVQGWDQGLIDQTAGSQVLLVVPPALGYPDRGTTVFVVDILDVWNPEE